MNSLLALFRDRWRANRWLRRLGILFSFYNTGGALKYLDVLG